jgi:hypothetical protein
LKKTLVGAELTNYNYLCAEMSKLVGKGGFCSIVATEDVDNQVNSIKVNPNPFENYLKIENTKGDEIYELSNSVGQVFYKGKNIETQDFSHLAKGVYFLKIGNRKSYKLVKE